MRKVLVAIWFAAACLPVAAQQDPQFSHNMFNRLQPNPATAGSNDAICGTLLYRSQWVSFEGAPKTGLLSVDMPVRVLHGGLGLTLMTDKLGAENTFNGKLAYALRLDVGSGKIALGADVGFMQRSLDGTKFNPLDPGDALIPQGKVSGSKFDFGAGVYYSSEHFYIGGSATHLQQGTIDYGDLTSEIKSHYYGMAGASLDLTPSVALKPSVFVKNVSPQTIADINLNVHFSNKFYVGASYRTEDAIVAMLGFTVFENLRIGYSYDITTSQIKDFSDGTHEVCIGYCYKIVKKEPPVIKNVRFL
jgi:type IX secretion system PorP/SprF family membrane protein